MRAMNVYRESDAGYGAALAAMNRRAIPGEDVRQAVADIIREKLGVAL